MSFVVVKEDGNFISFSDFINLEESVKPKETEFGSDFKNKAWKLTPDHSHLFTFFTHKDNHHVCVNINRHTGVLGFGTHHGTQSTNPLDYDETRKGHGEALKLFSKVAYVTIHGANHHDIDKLAFNGADPQLSTTYKKISHNKFFQKHMADHGFTYKGQDDNQNHIFERK